MEKRIEYSQVLSSVKELRDRASTMQTIFNNVTSTVQRMTDAEVFKGIASTKIQEEFAQKRKEFDMYVDAVNRFAELYETATEKSEESEGIIAKIAGNLNNSGNSIG